MRADNRVGIEICATLGGSASDLLPRVGFVFSAPSVLKTSVNTARLTRMRHDQPFVLPRRLTPYARSI